MTEHEAVALIQRLTVLAEVFAESMSPTRLAGYQAALNDLPFDDVCAALDHALKTSKFFPRPAELRDTCGDLASKRWERQQALEGPPDRLRLSPGDKLATEDQWQDFLANMRRIIKTMPEPARITDGKGKR